MDDNVMKKYTTKSQEARHYVQYDQGEDRWLCTLLLQRGYRVEYSAASDAYTHCPEGFNEFYNQRRRWVPSTMANIMDLLMDSKRTIEINDNISMPYIAYQILLMGGTILGPGTIFLMLVGAFVAAFQIDNWTSFYYNIMPILFFMLVCFTCKSNIQVSDFGESWKAFVICECFFAVDCCSDSVDRLCVDYDGGYCWYCVAVEGGRYWFSLGDIFDSDDGVVLYSGVSASSRVLVYRSWNYLFVVHPVYVPVAYFVFDHQFKCCLLGYS